jgi:hypothetical protein
MARIVPEFWVALQPQFVVAGGADGIGIVLLSCPLVATTADEPDESLDGVGVHVAVLSLLPMTTYYRQ